MRIIANCIIPHCCWFCIMNSFEIARFRKQGGCYVWFIALFAPESEILEELVPNSQMFLNNNAGWSENYTWCLISSIFLKPNTPPTMRESKDLFFPQTITGLLSPEAPLGCIGFSFWQSTFVRFIHPSSNRLLHYWSLRQWRPSIHY